MRKKIIGATLLAFTLTLATGITAFAGWIEEDGKWAYQKTDGSRVYASWFTDPETELTYFFDPEGYMMTGTEVQGFRIGDDGARIEKTAEELAEELAQQAEIDSRPRPSVALSEAELAAAVAKSANSAAENTRLSYQAEMLVFMDKAYVKGRTDLIAADVTDNLGIKNALDNVETTYSFTGQDRGVALSSTLWEKTNAEFSDFHSTSFETHYSRAILTEAEAVEFDKIYNSLLKYSLGETVGQDLYNEIFALLSQGTYEFGKSALTEAGNVYTIGCKNGTLSLTVTTTDNFSDVENAVVAAELAKAVALPTEATAQDAATQEATTQE